MVRQPAVQMQTVGAFAETFEAVIDNVAQVLQGKEDPDPVSPGVPGRRRASAARGCAGRWQDQPGQGAGPTPSTCNGVASSSRPTCCPLT